MNTVPAGYRSCMAGAGDDAASSLGRGGTARAIALYAGTVLGGLVGLVVILHGGHGLHAPLPPRQARAQTPAASTEDVVWRLLLASAVVIVAARLAGAAFQRINQPQVVGEIAAGILLGPSVLGRIAPATSAALFARPMLPYLDVLSQIGLLLFMFLIGLELDYRLIRGRGHAAATVSHVSIIVPFLLGAGAAVLLFPTLGSASGRFTPFALFLGASMSITAFPVLARILAERGLYKTRLGAVTLTCAAVDDVTAWCILAVVVAVTRAHGPVSALRTVGLAVAFISFMVGVIRPLLGRLARWHEERGEIGGGMLAALFVGILLSALATDRIGIHAIFGAFLFGAIMPQRSELIAELVGKLEDFTVVFLLPLYFAYTGLRTNIGLLGGDAKLWLSCGLILAVAIIGKWGGSSLAGKVVGLDRREAMAVGVLMNTRGLTELIILNIGLDLKVIPPALFAMLVIMALVTTFMTTPLLSFFYGGEELDRMVEEASGGDEDAARRYTIVVAVDRPDRGADLVHTALRLVRDEDEEARIILVRAVALPGSAYRAGPRVQESIIARAQRGLRPLVQLVEGAGYSAVPVVVPSRRPADAIVEVARERGADLVLVGWRRSLWGNRILHGSVGKILRDAPADVAIVVDPKREGLPLQRGDRILVPYGGGYHEDVSIDLALRLARAAGADVQLLGPGEGEREAKGLAERAAKAYEDTGVWTEPIGVDDEPGTRLLEEAGQADLVVLGVGDAWIRDKQSLGGLRQAVAARTTAPIIIVRRAGQKGGRLRRPREWLEPSGEHPAVDAADAPRPEDVSAHLT